MLFPDIRVYRKEREGAISYKKPRVAGTQLGIPGGLDPSPFQQKSESALSAVPFYTKEGVFLRLKRRDPPYSIYYRKKRLQ